MIASRWCGTCSASPLPGASGPPPSCRLSILLYSLASCLPQHVHVELATKCDGDAETAGHDDGWLPDLQGRHEDGDIRQSHTNDIGFEKIVEFAPQACDCA